MSFARAFLVLERRLLRGKPPPSKLPHAGARDRKEPGLSCRARPSVREPRERPSRVNDEVRAKVLETLSRSYRPGDPVGVHDVMRITGYCLRHSQEIVRSLKGDGAWPFAKAAGARGRQRR